MYLLAIYKNEILKWFTVMSFLLNNEPFFNNYMCTWSPNQSQDHF